MKKFWFRFLMILLFFLAVKPVHVLAEEDANTILILNSYHQGFAWTDEQMEGIQEEIKDSGKELEIYVEYLDWKKFPTDHNEKGFYDLIQYKYTDKEIDIVICTDDAAFQFALQYRKDLFEDTPIVFSGVGETSFEELVTNQDRYTGIMQVMDPYGTIQAAKQINPNLDTIYVIYDNTKSGKAIGNECLEAAKQISGEIQVVLLNNLATERILEKVWAADENSIVLMTNYVLDGKWVYLSQEKFCEQISKVSKVPVYHLYHFGMGHGILGGDMILGTIQGQKAAQLALQILDGKSADEIPIQNENTNQIMFDYTVMQKFGISKSELPQGSEIINEPPDFFELYKTQIIAALIVFILLLAFTISLLFYIYKIRIMQKKLKENHEELTQLYEEITASDEEMRAQYDEIIEAHELLEISNNKLLRLTQHDTLTGLYNRHYLYHVLDVILKVNQIPCALYFLDLDNFKYVNDTLGHTLGDTLLKKISERMNGILVEGIHLVRLGGDEFVFFYENISDKKGIEEFALKILSVFESPFMIEDNNLMISGSLGIALSPNNGRTMEILLKNADMAMYYIKNRGKKGFYFFDTSLDEMMRERVGIERKFASALENNEFFVVYQPQICPEHESICGFEALARWQPDGELISPLKFIKIAEETGFIIPLGEWILRKACMDIASLNKDTEKEYFISVNVSVIQLLQIDFAEKAIQIIEETGINPRQLILEVTESVFMESSEQIKEHLMKLRAMSVGIALDDFGTGYSSLAYLKDFPITTLKVDKLFIDSIETSEEVDNITDTIIQMGHNMNMKVVAEGVEAEKQVIYLKNSHCDLIQGFFYAKPMTYNELTAYISTF
ncbi:MAG: ABC transporter substrate binding protein [Lachnospiraceae bacterium]|nr:ABC transporter substrate binding protein [Lachnospiraceae bacterium]